MMQSTPISENPEKTNNKKKRSKRDVKLSGKVSTMVCDDNALKD